MAIDTALDTNPDTDPLGPFSSTDTNAEPLCVRRTIYLLVNFVGLLLELDLTPMEAWTRLFGTIVDRGL